MPGHTLPLGRHLGERCADHISESPTHVVIAAEISKAMLVGYRRLFEQLIAADEQRESPR
jgi:hypothetical protein